MNPLGASRLEPPAEPGVEAIYDALANCHYDDLHPSFRYEFESILISERELKRWRAISDDPIGTRIKRVLTAAAEIARGHDRPSYREVADRLVDRSIGRSVQYSVDSMRKILGGRLPQQRDRGIPGLRKWMASRG